MKFKLFDNIEKKKIFIIIQKYAKSVRDKI